MQLRLLFSPALAQDSPDSLADLLSGCSRSGTTYYCRDHENLPLYDSLMRNESAGMSREQDCYANLNTVEYQGTSWENVHVYHAECSYLSNTYYSLTYACLDQPEIICELIDESPKQ